MRNRLSSLLLPLLHLHVAGVASWFVLWRMLGDANGWLALANAWAFWLLLTSLPSAVVVCARFSVALALGWVAGVGSLLWRLYAPIFFRSPLPNPSLDDDAAHHLTVLSANLRNDPRDLRATADLFLAQSADLMLFQEAILSHVAQLAPALAESHPHQCWIPYPHNRMGLAAVSRLPFAVTGFWQDVGLEPYALRLSIALAGEPLDVYCIHFIAPAHQIRRLGPTALLRTREQQIRTVLAAIAERPYPALVAGDWNSTEGADSYRWTTAQLVDGWAEGGAGPGWSWPRLLPELGGRRSQPLLRLDYLFHTGTTKRQTLRVASMRRITTRIGSDHCPLVTHLAILPNKQGAGPYDPPFVGRKQEAGQIG